MIIILENGLNFLARLLDDPRGRTYIKDHKHIVMHRQDRGCTKPEHMEKGHESKHFKRHVHLKAPPSKVGARS